MHQLVHLKYRNNLNLHCAGIASIEVMKFGGWFIVSCVNCDVVCVGEIKSDV